MEERSHVPPNVFEEQLSHEGVDTMQTVGMTSVLTARGRSEEVRPTGSQENRNSSGVGVGSQQGPVCWEQGLEEGTQSSGESLSFSSRC